MPQRISTISRSSPHGIQRNSQAPSLAQKVKQTGHQVFCIEQIQVRGLAPPRRVPVALPRRKRLERLQPDLLAWHGVGMQRLRNQAACLEG